MVFLTDGFLGMGHFCNSLVQGRGSAGMGFRLRLVRKGFSGECWFLGELGGTGSWKG